MIFGRLTWRICFSSARAVACGSGAEVVAAVLVGVVVATVGLLAVGSWVIAGLVVGPIVLDACERDVNFWIATAAPAMIRATTKRDAMTIHRRERSGRTGSVPRTGAGGDGPTRSLVAGFASEPVKGAGGSA